MTRRFVTCDVFTDVRFGGNPLAVVLDADGLDTGVMQQIAGELNLSETVFFAPAEMPGADVGLRIFTPRSELPFAGHPTVGAAVVARWEGLVAADTTDIVIAEGVGPVPVRLAPDADHATLTAAQLPVPSDRVSAADVAAVLSVPEAGVGDGRVWSCGLPFLIAAVDGLGTLEAIEVDVTALRQRVALPTTGIYVVVTDGDRVRARMFAPLDGIPEDPATGSAACALAGWWVDAHPPGPGTHEVVVEQGVEMGRPSRLELSVTVGADGIERVQVGGGVVPVSRGTIEV